MHDVVKLLLARMESHPEEFENTSILGDSVAECAVDRWWQPLDRIMDWGSEEEKAAIRAALRKIKLNAAHVMAMDELCNGEDRRRKEREEEEQRKQAYANHQAYAQQALAGSYPPALGQAMQSTKKIAAVDALNRAFKYQPGPDAYEFTHQGFTTTYTREALEDNPGIFASIKKALGI